MRFFILVLCLVFSLSANSFDQLNEKITEDTLPLYHPGVTTALSIIPGGARIYTGRYKRAALFFGVELLMGSQAYMRWRWYHDAYEPYYDARSKYDSLYSHVYSGTLSAPDSVQELSKMASLINRRDLLEFDIEKARTDYLNWSVWFGGIYLWNLVDAVGASNRFQGAENPTPKRAALLSAIPFTGAGQFYNGRFFKGAMVSVVEIACMISAINFTNLRDKAEEYENNLMDLPDSLYHKIPTNELSSWSGRYDNASRSRTMFMWYGVFFYLYGIADAAVDAHLHGFERNFDITGGLDPLNGKISMAFSGEFGTRKSRRD